MTEITKCVDCGCRAMTYGSEECSKCGGKLEVIAQTKKFNKEDKE